MKKFVFCSSVIVVSFALFFVACHKNEGNSVPANTPDSVVTATEDRGSDSGSTTSYSIPGGGTIYVYPLSGGSAQLGGAESQFCCDINWVGFQNLPFPPYYTAMTFSEKRFTIPGASQYRRRATCYRNDVLIFDVYFPDWSGNCEDYGLGIVYPFPTNCCGEIHISVTKEYRVGNTWYTCDAAHGEFGFYPAGCGWCE
jgi:hypothetical protein